MADQVKEIINGIDFKVRKLKHDYQIVTERNKELENKLNQLEQTIYQQKQEIEHIQQKIKLIKLSKSIENKRDLTETKLKINELVREIDNCINLLNK